MGCYGVAIALMIRSGLGLGPWDAFHQGMSRLTGLSIGQSSVLTGVGVLAASMAMGMRPGVGTLANMVLIGMAVDLVLPLIPDAAPVGGVALALLYYAIGIAAVGFATGMYIAAAFGSGPRDGMMVALSARLRWPVRRVRLVMEASVLGAGWAMGGTLGLGTVLFLVGAGPATQWGMQRFGLVGRSGAASQETARSGGRRSTTPRTAEPPTRAA